MALKVVEAYTRDVGRFVARIDEKTLKKLKIKLGAPVLIKGAHGKTVVKALALYPDDENKSIIRIDLVIRENAKLQFGNKVNIEKTEIKEAKSVVFMYAKDDMKNPPVDDKYIIDILENVIVTKAMKVILSYFGGRLDYKIVKTDPKGYVQITKKTVGTIKERPDTKIKDQDMLNQPEYIQAKITNCEVFLEFLTNKKIKNPDLIQALAIIWSRK